jgi:3-hydroxymyristoyl/3-hydroxydecanoyl-(acyl carrier protein) dehydratase
VVLEKIRRGVGKASVRASVGDQVACEGTILFAVAERQ